MKKSLNPNREERLRQNLKALDLQKIAEIFPEYTRQATQAEVGYLAYLDHLIAQEAAWRHERMVKYRIGAAKLPFRKSLSDYDFSWPTRINKQKVLDLFDLSFIQKKSNAVLIGQTGLGKTHLCVALAFAACEANISVRFTTAVGMVNHLTAAMADHTLAPNSSSTRGPSCSSSTSWAICPSTGRGRTSYSRSSPPATSRGRSR